MYKVSSVQATNGTAKTSLEGYLQAKNGIKKFHISFQNKDGEEWPQSFADSKCQFLAL